VDPLMGRGDAMISLWFVVHEISQGRVDPVVRFFTALRDLVPEAQILLGEIARLPPETLERVRSTSIMPEFTLFHDLSGQGLLTWEDWQEAAARIPYRVVAEKHFDPVAAGGVPSSFVWRLAPS
jgi:hypothetical protein